MDVLKWDSLWSKSPPPKKKKKKKKKKKQKKQTNKKKKKKKTSTQSFKHGFDKLLWNEPWFSKIFQTPRSSKIADNQGNPHTENRFVHLKLAPDSKVHGANMGSIWGRQVPGGPNVGPMNFAIWFFQWGLMIAWAIRNIKSSSSQRHPYLVHTVR